MMILYDALLGYMHAQSMTCVIIFVDGKPRYVEICDKGTQLCHVYK